MKNIPIALKKIREESIFNDSKALKKLNNKKHEIKEELSKEKKPIVLTPAMFESFIGSME